MRLKLSDLQRVVKQTLQEKKHVDAFCDEIKKTFGPSVIVRDDLKSLVETANERLDVIEYQGRLNTVKFPRLLALGMANHESAEVRKFVARVLPENAAVSMLFDSDESVRLAAAKKAPLKMVKKASQAFPKDIGLKDIVEHRTLFEAAGAVSALEASAKHADEDMLSDAWYEDVARKLIQDYGRTLDTTWKTPAVKQYCSSVRATTRLPVDAGKLMEKMDEILKSFDDARSKDLGLKESIDHRGSFVMVEDFEDPVDLLLDESLSPQEYLNKCDVIFGIKYASLPPAIMKYKINEGLSINKIPVSCKLPHLNAPRRIDEIALDTFVKNWNDKQRMAGEPFKLNWDLHPDSANKITFKLELK
jgi:hypothetical protein